MGQVEMQRGHRDPPARHGVQVRPWLVLVSRRGPVDPVATPSLLLGVEAQLVAVDALAELGHLDAVGWTPGTLMLSSVAGGSGALAIDADERLRSRRRARSRTFRLGEIHLAGARLLRDGDRGDPEHDALQRRGDGPRVGDVVAEV